MKVQMHRAAQSEIAGKGVPSYVPSGPDCITDVEWLNVAAGLVPEVRARELMKHAVQCGHCGPLLKNAAETLSDEVTSSEEQLLATLSRTRTEWQKGMAQALQERNRGREVRTAPWWQGWLSKPRQAFAVAALASVIALIWLGSRMLSHPSVEQLLAQAYTDRRTLEMRISGARFAPVRVRRGQGESNIDKPPSLLKAESIIGENLRKDPNEPSWLRARGEADLLDGNYESAIKSVQIALERQSDSPALLTDLASAYFERAETANRAIDYGNAMEALGKALAKSPDDPVALFNRAITSERLFLYTQAVEDWEHYLRVEPSGEWADEARNRLTAVKQKLQRRQSQSIPLLEPSEIAEGEIADARLREKIDQRVEEYLHVAVTRWLPSAFSLQLTGQPSARDAQTALRVLAAIAVSRHADPWLAELLDGPRGERFPSAILALSVAVQSDDRGDYSRARGSANTASRLFRSVGNLQGELRARAEEVYADHLLYEGRRCFQLVGTIGPLLETHGYGWLQSEMSLEESNCAALIGEMGVSKRAIVKGTRQARSHNYLSLYLRGLGFEADADAIRGDPTTAFSLASEGLRLFWSSEVDVMKGYNLYTDLDTAADDLHLSHLQVALWQQATDVIDHHPDILQRAMAHRWYGNAAYLADMPRLAADEFAKASGLFAAAPQTTATSRDHMDAEIWLAHIESRQGDVERAADRLRHIQPVLDSAPSFAPEIAFYSTQVDIDMHRADFDASESALRSAIFLAEWALSSFRSETERRQWVEQTRDAYYDLVAWKLRQGDPTSALELWEWYKGAELRAHESTGSEFYRSPNLTTPPDARNAPVLPNPRIVTDHLSSLQAETVIVYATFPDGIAIWSYDDRGVVSQWISQPLPQVRDLAVRFERLCSEPTSDLVALQRTSHAIYDLLVAPIEAQLDVRRTLVFEPDTVLDRVPFEALLDHTGHYLIERSAITISPGLYRSMRLRRPESITSNSSALVVSVPAPAGNGVVPLADAEDEAEAVADNFRSAHRLSASAATLSSIRQEIRGVSIFHFVGHATATAEGMGLLLGEIDPRTEDAQLLGADSLQPEELSRLQLAVLSACQTHVSADTAVSGNEGLAQALLQAEVPHVVATRWSIDSAETLIFVKEFYAHLLAGEDVSRSLRSAALRLAGEPASAHPYYWAAFEEQGL